MFSELLVHTVDVYARSGRKDRFGQPVDVNPRQHVAGEAIVATYPCRVYQRSGGLTTVERSIDVFERIWEMFTEADADIREDDAVRVTDADGNVLINLAKIKSEERVFASGLAPHHRQYAIWEQSGPTPARTA